MKVTGRFILLVALLATVTATAGAQVREDQVVLDWNATTLAIAPGPTHPRALAMVHIAMFDAVNAIDTRYEPYLTLPAVTTAADVRAAAAGAAHGVLARLVPAQQPALAAALARSLAAVPDGAEKAAGLAVGDEAAAAIVALRASDKFSLPNPVYVPGAGPAAYQLTPPAFVNPVNQNAHLFQPFVMSHAGQFRPNGPPRLDGGRFAGEYEEVRLMGAACPDPASCARTLEQTMIARWHTEQAFPQMSRIARSLTLESAGNLVDTARTFALLAMATADAFVSVFEAKYVFAFVRPVTAIRAGDADGMDETTGDPGWTPLFPTPPHPEYPSAHAVIQAAAAHVIQRAFGVHAGFETTAATVPGVTRSFPDVDAFVADGQEARIYGGMHFRTAVEEGRKQGRKVGALVTETALRPLD